MKLSKKTSQRFLLQWNEKKHPEVVEFFNNIEEGYYSHSVREAIKFYVMHQMSQQKTNTPEPQIREFQGCDDNSGTKFSDTAENSLDASKKDEYEDFDPKLL